MPSPTHLTTLTHLLVVFYRHVALLQCVVLFLHRARPTQPLLICTYRQGLSFSSLVLLHVAPSIYHQDPNTQPFKWLIGWLALSSAGAACVLNALYTNSISNLHGEDESAQGWIQGDERRAINFQLYLAAPQTCAVWSIVWYTLYHAIYSFMPTPVVTSTPVVNQQLPTWSLIVVLLLILSAISHCVISLNCYSHIHAPNPRPNDIEALAELVSTTVPRTEVATDTRMLPPEDGDAAQDLHADAASGVGVDAALVVHTVVRAAGRGAHTQNDTGPVVDCEAVDSNPGEVLSQAGAGTPITIGESELDDLAIQSNNNPGASLKSVGSEGLDDMLLALRTATGRKSLSVPSSPSPSLINTGLPFGLPRSSTFPYTRAPFSGETADSRDTLRYPTRPAWSTTRKRSARKKANGRIHKSTFHVLKSPVSSCSSSQAGDTVSSLPEFVEGSSRDQEYDENDEL